MSTSIDSSAQDAASVAPVEFTAAAAARVRELIAEQGNPGLKLRVCVSGGGCSGFQYEFKLDAQQAGDDLAIECAGTTLLVDPLSAPYLAGARVDYAESLGGAQFVVHNPNAHATCGCGTSFSL